MTLTSKSILGLAVAASFLYVHAGDTKTAAKASDAKAVYSIEGAKKFFEAELAYKAVPHDINEIVKDKAKHPNDVIVDVRDADSFKKGHIPGAINIPNGELTDEVVQI